jgi:hypothetical protein
MGLVQTRGREKRYFNEGEKRIRERRGIFLLNICLVQKKGGTGGEIFD